MLQVLRSVLTLAKPDGVIVDGVIFRLHCRVTASALLMFSLIVTSRQYLGDPIECVLHSNIPKSVVNTYCWVQVRSRRWMRLT